MPIYKMSKKKDGLQQYRVRVNYVDRDGRSRQMDRTVYGLAEAKELERSLTREVKERTAGVSRLTVSLLYTEYISVKRHQVRESTLAKCQQALDHHVLPALGDIRIDRLSAQTLQRWKTGIEEKDLAIQTRKNIYGEFHALLNYAVKMEYLFRNPLDLVGNFKEVYFASQQDKLQYYTPEQFKAYKEAAARSVRSITDWGYYVFFCIAYYTGMRKGEINALKWSDIDGDVIHVRRSIAQKLKGGDRETPPKNKSSLRDLQIPVPLQHILAEHKARQQAGADSFTDDFRVCGGIACLRDTSIDKKNRQFAALAGLPHIRVHYFRHSHASLLANEGINIQEIARRLGHSDIKTTWQTYAHLYPREEERAIQILNKIE